MDPNSGSLTRFTMPGQAISDPHTLVFGGRHHIWFTAQWSNTIGRLDKRSGEIDSVHIPLDGARPYGIRLDSNGRPWVALLGTNALATVNPGTLELEVVRMPRAEARPRRIAVTGDDAVWYTDYDQGYLGRYRPATGAFSEWKNPSEDSGPYAIATDDQGRIWLVETWPEKNRLVGFDPVSETFFSLTEIPSGAGAVRHMVFDPGRNSIWFGTDTNNLGQALLPPPGVPGLPPVSE
jgi:virginiamycin B lyase